MDSLGGRGLYTSTRERRLWLATLAIVIAILSTVGVAPRVAFELQSRDVLGLVFAWGMFLVAATIVAKARQWRVGYFTLGSALGFLAIVLLLIVRVAAPEERTHLIEYGVLAAFMLEAFRERARSRRASLPLPPAIAAALIATTIGALDESIQVLVPGRFFDPRDLLFNTLAVVSTITLSVVLTRARRP